LRERFNLGVLMSPDVLVTALDAVSDAVLVCDRVGAVVHANRPARELFGALPVSREEIMRHPLGSAAREQHLPNAAVVVIPRFRPPLSLAQRERQAIEQALEESGWQLAIAARRLGISRTTLWRRLKQYGMSRPSELAVTQAV
jgi:transcriptional regulator of acetoin/glycerol metabolism